MPGSKPERSPKRRCEGLRGARGAAKNRRTTERAVREGIGGEALEDRPLEPANFLRGMGVDDRDVIRRRNYTALAFGNVDASIETQERRAAVVRCERSGGANQRRHDQQRKNN